MSKSKSCHVHFYHQLRGQQDLIEEFKKEQLNNLNRLKETGLAFAAEQKKALQSCIAESQKMYKSQTEQNEVSNEYVGQCHSMCTHWSDTCRCFL